MPFTTSLTADKFGVADSPAGERHSHFNVELGYNHHVSERLPWRVRIVARVLTDIPQAWASPNLARMVPNKWGTSKVSPISYVGEMAGENSANVPPCVTC